MMKTKNLVLTAILILLIGILLGSILMLFKQGGLPYDLAEVKITEVKRGDIPLWTDEELSKIDDRFVFRNVAKMITPAVVYIETVVPVRNSGVDSNSDDSDGFWQRFMPPRARTVGSGVIFSEDGYIITNNHVIEDAVRGGIVITLDDKRTFDARIVGRDPSTDLAVLKIDGNGLTPVIVGNSDNVDVGEWVLAVGNPFRLRSTVTAGIVSALSRDVQIIDDAMRIESFIQTDAAINRGNSGGALVNTSGELIGINTAIATQSGNYQGYGFAVPSNLAFKVARDIIEFGEVKRGLLGVIIQSVDESTAVSSGLDEIRGVLVVDVPSDGAASKSGIQASDIILAVNGELVYESNQLQEKVAMYRPDEELTLTIWREGIPIEKVVTLQEIERSPEPEVIFEEETIEPDFEEWNNERRNQNNSGVQEENVDDIGITIRALAKPENPDLFDLFIHRVESNSLAWNLGIPEEAQILEINKRSVSDLTVAKNLIENSLKQNEKLELKIKTVDGSIGFYLLN